MNKADIKDAVKISLGTLKRVRYLPSYWRGPSVQRAQNFTQDSYEESWAGIERELPELCRKMHIARLNGRFERISYGQLTNRYIRAHRQAIQDYAGKTSDLKILEVGAGFGRIWYPLAALLPQHNFYAIEYSHAGVKVGHVFRGKYENDIRLLAGEPIAWPIKNTVSYKQGDAKAIEYPDGFFDVSYTNLVLEQIPNSSDHSKVLLEMKRVTKGLCCFLEPWKEAQGVLDYAYLIYADYFRENMSLLEKLGFKDVRFHRFPTAHNLRFRLGFVTARP